MSYIEVVESRFKELAIRIDKIREELVEYPDGVIRCARNGKYMQWYQHIDGEPRIFIRKSEQNKAEELAYKQLLLDELATLLKEQKIIAGFLKKYRKLEKSDTKQYSRQNAEIKRLTQCRQNEDEEISRFLFRKYEEAPFQDNLTFVTKSGLRVRSKAENAIADMLDSYGIPYRYEVPYRFKRDNRIHVVYLDFTIMNPITHEIFGWTHMGCMDDEVYVERNKNHIADLYKAGFIADANLIITFEGGGHRLSTAEIDEKIRRFFPGVMQWK